MTDPTGRDLLDEQMDQRLQDAGARWRDALPPPAPTAPTSLRPHRRWLVPVGAAAAVAIVVGTTFALSTRDDGPDRTPVGADGPGSDTCGPGDLVAGHRALTTAGGTSILSAYLALTPGTSSCIVEGFPEVQLLDHGEITKVGTTHDGLDPGGTHVIAQDEPAIIELTWTTGARDCRSIDNDEVRIRLGDGAEVSIEGFGPQCFSGGSPEPVRVLPLLQMDHQVKEVRVRGTVTLDGGPAPGTTIPVTSGQISFDGESTSAGTSISSDGSYEVKLPPGDYDVSVSTPDWNGGQTYEAVTYRVSGGGTNRLDVRLPIR